MREYSARKTAVQKRNEHIDHESVLINESPVAQFDIPESLQHDIRYRRAKTDRECNAIVADF